MAGGDPVRPGVHAYIGTTGTGKTYLAIQEAFPLARSLGVGVLVIDTRGAENWRDMPVVENRGAIATVFRARAIAHVIPKSMEDFEELIRAADQYGNAVLIIDECATFATSPALALLVRVWRHRRVSIFLTTQKVGRDVEQSVLACDPVIRLFRVTNSATLEWAFKYHARRIVPGSDWSRSDRRKVFERLESLQRGQHYVLGE